MRSRSLLSVENPQNFQQAACDWFRHIFFRDEGEIRQQSDNKETHLNSNYRGYCTYTFNYALHGQTDNGTQRNNYVSVKAWNLFVWLINLPLYPCPLLWLWGYWWYTVWCNCVQVRSARPKLTLLTWITTACMVMMSCNIANTDAVNAVYVHYNIIT